MIGNFYIDNTQLLLLIIMNILRHDCFLWVRDNKTFINILC